MFPTGFGFEYAAVNAGLPEEFIDRFAQMSTVSINELFELYLYLIDTYGNEFGHLAPTASSFMFHSTEAIQSVMGSFINFNSRSINLMDPRFLNFLELSGRVYSDWNAQSGGGIVSSILSLQADAREAVFRVRGVGLNSIDAFFTAEPPIFMHHIPIADDNGKLLLDIPGIDSQIWSGICITSRADGALAWELTKSMVYAYAYPVGRAAIDSLYGIPNPWGSHSLSTPILRPLFRDHALRTFEEAFETWDKWFPPLQTFVGFDDPINRRDQIENAINRIAAYNEQPMGMLSPMIPRQLYMQPYRQFLNGLIDAETAAQRMQNAISLWLIE